MAKTSNDELRGKVVLITGGNGGIGAATTRELIARGASVVIADIDPRTPDRTQQRYGSAAMGYVVDVRDRASLAAVVAQTLDRQGRIDVAIANAGLLARAATMRTTAASAFDSTMGVNVTGVVNTVATTIEPVIAQRGQIVLIGSVFAFLNGMGTIPYAMSKAAVEQLGRALRVELADHGVNVLTAYLSMVDTDMVARGVDEDPVVVELLATLPKALLKRVAPASAARAIADGLDARAARVLHPGRWSAISALRGVLGPTFDARLSTDRRTLDILARLERPLPAATTSTKGLS